MAAAVDHRQRACGRAALACFAAAAIIFWLWSLAVPPALAPVDVAGPAWAEPVTSGW